MVHKIPEFYLQKSLQPNTSANLIVIANVTLYMTFIEEGSYTHELHWSYTLSQWCWIEILYLKDGDFCRFLVTYKVTSFT